MVDSNVEQALPNLSDLQQTAAALEKSLHRWESLLFVATLLVVVGLILEYFHQVRELVKKRPIKWKSIMEIVGAVFVVLGVSGELLIQHKASAVETSLQSVSRNIEGLLNLKIADANAAASKAGALAESERLERVKLEAIVAPRSLSLEQQRKMATSCSKFRGRRAIVTSYGLDLEGIALGGQIIAILKSAGVDVVDSRASIVEVGAFEIGVRVRGPASEQDFVSALGDALSSVGKLQVSINDSSPSGGGAVMPRQSGAGGFIYGGGVAVPAGRPFVTVMVGIKPIPILPVK